MITYTNSLDFCPGGVPLFVRLSQYDSNFSLVFNCFSHKGDFTVENGSTAVFREHKPDGNVISIDATVSGTTVTLTPSADNAKQMTAIKGHCECEISLQKNGKELSSANFVLLVEKAPVDIDAVQSDSVIRELYDVADRAEEILEAAETVDEAISDLPNLIDSTLTLPNHAADAKKTGDELANLSSAIEEIEPLSGDVKTALLNCFAHVVWIDEHGHDYYDALESALYADRYPRITAVFDPGLNIIYTDDSLDSLKQYLTVKYFETEESTGTIVAASDYTLAGTLVVGTNEVSVFYSGLTTSFIINGVIDFYNVWEWNWTQSNERQMHIINGTIAVVANTYNGAIINANATMSANRRAFGVYKGRLPYSSYQTGQDLEYYPVPIPSNANKITVSITPVERYVLLEIVRLNNGQYTLYSSQGATQGEKVATFTAGENLFACVGTKYSVPDAEYSEAPTGFNITFEEV